MFCQQNIKSPNNQCYPIFEQLKPKCNINRMQLSHPQINYVLIGFDNVILVDHYERYTEQVNYTSDVFFPSINKKGINIQKKDE